ncbi:hypothetical protein ACWEKT_40550 [Nocardia takedensis]|uniref:hypothetical protein n=1 Tax=Nocardia takedensis TaxID=259390 RepID=UPI001FE12FF4|nr:hypothetical protein [Nocardia takedensis]
MNSNKISIREDPTGWWRAIECDTGVHGVATLDSVMCPRAIKYQGIWADRQFPNFVDDPMLPGNLMEAGISRTTSGYTLYLRNLTYGWTVTRYSNNTEVAGTAEIIVEGGAFNLARLPLLVTHPKEDWVPNAFTPMPTLLNPEISFTEVFVDNKPLSMWRVSSASSLLSNGRLQPEPLCDDCRNFSVTQN